MDKNNIGCSGLLIIAIVFIMSTLFLLPASINKISGESLDKEIKEQLEELKKEFVFKEDKTFEVKEKSISTESFPFHAFNTLTIVNLTVKDKNGNIMKIAVPEEMNDLIFIGDELKVKIGVDKRYMLSENGESVYFVYES